MGSWAFDTFVRTTDVSAIELALQQVLALDGYEPVANPALGSDGVYADAEHREIVHVKQGYCGALIIPATSRDGTWSYIRTTPDELLPERASGTQHPRLVELAKLLQVDAFRFEVEDGDSSLILECRYDGVFRVSGSISMDEEWINDTDEDGPEDIIFRYFGETVDDYEATFGLLLYLEHFNPCISRSAEDAANEVEIEFLGKSRYEIWEVYSRLFDTTPANLSQLGATALYFRKEDE